MITKEEVKHIAKLARLELTEEELDNYTKQLGDILKHAEMLEEVKTEGVEPIAQITGLESVHFKDEVENCEVTDELLEQSPQDKQDHMIKVKNVF